MRFNQDVDLPQLWDREWVEQLGFTALDVHQYQARPHLCLEMVAQRIGIARALYHNPSVLVLDEATSSLDTLTERGVMRAVGAMHGQKTIIIVAHRFSTLQDCDRVFSFEDGRLVAQGDAGSMIGPPARSAIERVSEAGR